MKRLLAWAVIIGLILSLAGCGGKSQRSADIRSISSYREIPGVTQEEIAAIERLKETKDQLIWGSSISTVAFVLPDGSFAGFTPRVCELFSSLFGIEFELTFYSWDNLVSGLNGNEIDFTGELTSTSERLTTYYMTHAIAEQSLSIYTRVDSAPLRIEMDLQGMRIGFLAGSVTPWTIRESYPVSFEIVDVATYAHAVAMLESGEIDAFVDESVVDPVFAEYEFIQSKSFFSLVYNPVSLATANPELEPVISVVNKYLVAGGIDVLFDFYHAGEREYAKNKLYQSLTQEEKKYLKDLVAQGTKVPVAYEHENYPVSFYNRREGEYQGFAIEIMEEITYLTGLKFEPVTKPETPWPEIMEMLKSGQAAMVTQLLYSDARKDDFLWNRNAYATSYYALLSKTGYPDIANYQVIRATVGIIDQTGHQDMYREWFPDSGKIQIYDNHEAALVALEHDEIDLLMASEYTLLHQTNFREKPGFKANIRFGVPMESLFGFNKNQTDLCAIIDKTLPYIDTETIAQRWTDRVFDYSRKYTAAFALLLSVFAAALILSLILVLRLWQRSNRLRMDLERETNTLSTMFTTIPDILYSKDRNLRYTICNPSFEKLAGVPADQIAGKTALELFAGREEMAQQFTSVDERVCAENAVQTAENWYIFPDGSRRLFEAVKAPLTKNGEVVGVMGISRDITEHKQAEEAAQAASKAKSVFLAHMSHEIRTPMNAISGMTELILREDIPSAIYEYILSIKHASANLLSLINDILDVSKIEAGSLEIVPADYLFSSLINDILIIARMKVSEKPILFTANIDCDIPNHLKGDETRIRQIFLNILGNAAKYTNEGFVSLTVSGRIEGNLVVLTVDIADSGVGVKEEDLAKLFGDFARFDGVKNKDVPGTGLGLAITQNLCKAMGGDISVVSEYGVGSTFTITIPQEIGENREPFARVQDPQSKRVLVYETRPLCADSIARALTGLGVPCTVSASRKDFYEAVRNGSYAYVFASSLLAENAAQVIEELSLNVQLVLLMEFGEAAVSREARTIAMPVHSASIANILNDVEEDILYNENGQGKARFVAPSASVLVVDDLTTNLKVAEGLLAPYEMKIDACTSGVEAVRRVRENRYDLIFMDHMMPEMDGIETTRRIRSLEDMTGYYQDVPIIALTANAVSGARETFLQNGMNDFLPKPIDLVKLNMLLEKWIPREKREKYKESREKRMPADRSSSRIQIDGVDVQAGIAMTGGRTDNYLRTLGIFRMDGLDKLDKIRECAGTGDFKLYTTYVHAMKSAAATIGARELSDFAKRLELAGTEGDDAMIRANTEPFLRDLEALLQSIKATLEESSGEEKAEHSMDPGLILEHLLKLGEALENMDAGEVDDQMSALERVNWGPGADALFQEVSKSIFLFNYEEAGALVEKLRLEQDGELQR